MKIEIKKGTVADVKADVLVNSCNQALMLAYGGLSKSFAKSAGPGLQAECSEKYPNGICFGDIAITNGYSLKCKNVYHAVMPAWDSEFADAAEILRLTVASCLRQANEDGMTSIAFPALGCGFLNYPFDFVAKVMHDSIASFDREVNSPTLQRILIVIWPNGAEWKHIKQAFEQGFRNYGKEERIPVRTPQELKQTQQQTVKDFLSTCIRETSRNSCKKVLPCGHVCAGYRNEPNCLPCLQAECVTKGQHQTSEDDCIICMNQLPDAPVIMLQCGHLYHLHCAKRILQNKWVGAKINFNFIKCPICKETMAHKELETLMTSILALQDDVRHKAVIRLQYEGLENCKDITAAGSKYYKKPEEFAMDRYIYYLCFKCEKPYFGGTTRTECGSGEDEEQFQPENLVCSNCRGHRNKKELSDAAIAEAVHTKENQKAREVIKTTTKPCPHCGAHTEKNGGCMHMTCIKCKMDWCWLCEKHWEYKCQRTHWFGPAPDDSDDLPGFIMRRFRLARDSLRLADD